MTFLIALLLGVGVPVGWWIFKESRMKNPAARWPDLADDLGLKFLLDPPRMEGLYKGRNFRISVDPAGAAVVTGLRGRPGLRFELGPKAVVEKAAGMVVHDRIALGDSAFEARYMVRCTPVDLGEVAADPSLRQRLMKLPDIHVIAVPDRVVVKAPFPSEASDARNYLDVASSVADALE